MSDDDPPETSRAHPTFEEAMQTLGESMAELSRRTMLPMAEAARQFEEAFARVTEINRANRAWSGSPDPADPDNYWIDDATGERRLAFPTPPDHPPCRCRLIDVTTHADSMTRYERDSRACSVPGHGERHGSVGPATRVWLDEADEFPTDQQRPPVRRRRFAEED